MTPGTRFFLLSFLFASFAVITDISRAQVGTAPAQPAVVPAMPSGPTELMKQAALVNGLDAPSIKPWHIKASYQVFGFDGKVKDEGTFEEWWAGPESSKIVYSGSKFHRTLYMTASGDYLVGDAGVLPPYLFLIRQAVVHPIEINWLPDYDYRAGTNPFKDLKLTCIERSVTGSTAAKEPLDKYCFEEGTKVLRFHETHARIDTVFQPMGLLGNQHLALGALIRIQGKNYISVKINEGNFIAPVSNADFSPPSSAMKLDHREVIEASDSTLFKKTSGPPPVYPVLAKQAREQGIVNLAALIGPDGRVKQVELLSQENGLSAAAIDAVKNWRYESSIAGKDLTETWLMVEVRFYLGD